MPVKVHQFTQAEDLLLQSSILM